MRKILACFFAFVLAASPSLASEECVKAVMGGIENHMRGKLLGMVQERRQGILAAEEMHFFASVWRDNARERFHNQSAYRRAEWDSTISHFCKSNTDPSDDDIDGFIEDHKDEIDEKMAPMEIELIRLANQFLGGGLIVPMDSKLTDPNRWVSAKGEFIGAKRALVDSAFGVAFGALGGVMVNSLMKSSQSESGFENVQCTINEIPVANWRDTFAINPK
ncbi:MAG: hypothetical protein LBG89_03880 [Rickettsiales bacterium]|jgi:hypothetical protein|nr:hypothetical protein [Rickettsiales bacterium]